MVNKRGLSPEEYFNLDSEVLDMLMIYDAYIEPSGIYVDMLFHAHNSYITSINNPNLTSESRKNITVMDFDFLDILSTENLSTLEKAEKREAENQEKQANNIKALGEYIKRKASGKNKNGK